MTENVELYERYRPRRLKDVVGQLLAVKTLTKWIDNKTIPHVILFSGPKGCGKTTLARIVRDELGCAECDYMEINVADDRGVDFIRSLQRVVSHAPAYGASRVVLFDECHQWTSESQSALLKVLEGVSRHVYYLLVTSEPEKLKPTVRDRCSEIKVNRLSLDDLNAVLTQVLGNERKQLSPKVTASLLECADGSARRLLVYLHQIIDLKNEEDQLNSLTPPTVREQAYSIVKALLGGTWTECLTVLDKVDEDPEKIRRMVLAGAVSAMSREKSHKKSGRANLIIEAFKYDFFGSGKAGIYNACYNVFAGI